MKSATILFSCRRIVNEPSVKLVWSQGATVYLDLISPFLWKEELQFFKSQSICGGDRYTSNIASLGASPTDCI